MSEDDIDFDEAEEVETKGPTWQEVRWKEIRGWLVTAFLVFLGFTFWDDVKGWFSPVHPAPASIEADGKTYVACDTPDIGRGYFHSTYYADFKDRDDSTVSLRGIDKLIVTNLPQMVDAPMPMFRSMPYPLPDVSGTDSKGKPYEEGLLYTFTDGSAAIFRNREWVPVPALPEIKPGMEGKTLTYTSDNPTVLTGGKAQVKNGKWVPIKVKNTVCTPDADQ